MLVEGSALAQREHTISKKDVDKTSGRAELGSAWIYKG
jgi:hypothetical protein